VGLIYNAPKPTRGMKHVEATAMTPQINRQTHQELRTLQGTIHTTNTHELTENDATFTDDINLSVQFHQYCV